MIRRIFTTNTGKTILLTTTKEEKLKDQHIITSIRKDQSRLHFDNDLHLSFRRIATIFGFTDRPGLNLTIAQAKTTMVLLNQKVFIPQDTVIYWYLL